MRWELLHYEGDVSDHSVVLHGSEKGREAELEGDVNRYEAKFGTTLDAQDVVRAAYCTLLVIRNSQVQHIR